MFCRIRLVQPGYLSILVFCQVEGYDSKPNKNNEQRKEIATHIEGDSYCVKKSERLIKLQ